MNKNWKYVPFDQLFDWKDKSIIKSGDGTQIGKYKLFVCSDTEVKRYDEYLENCEALVFGTGGKACCHYVNEKFAYSTDCVVATKKDSTIVTKFYYYYFRQNRLGLLQATFKGSGLQHTSKKKISDILVPDISISEQIKVVDYIETMLSKLDDGIETLKKTQQQLAVYRQAILETAFNGGFGVDKIEFATLPLSELVEGKSGLRRGPFGSSIKKAFFVESGYKVYEQGNAINDDPYRGSYFITAEKYNELKSFHVQPYDLLVSCSGVTLGRIVELPEDALDGVINQALLRIRLNKNVIINQYFIHYFRSESFQRRIFANSQGSAMPNLVGIKEFKNIEINVPTTIAAQEIIVNEIEKRMAVCDIIDSSIESALQQAEALRQSILKQAFEGEI